MTATPSSHLKNLPPRRLALHALALASFGVALAACASPDERAPAMMAAPLVQLEVVDRDSGRTLPLTRHAGRNYLAGAPGSRYALRLANRSGQRVLVVLAVDGVNVISGETAGWQQTGYVLEPGRTHDITGWRKSDTAVAAFEFAALRDSYASLTGRPGNVGVIGAAVFVERPRPPLHSVAPQIANATPAPAAAPRAESSAADAQMFKAAPAARERLGTGHGAQEWSVSRRTHFERASRTPTTLIELTYDSHENLVAAGVIAQPLVAQQPRAFPLSPTGSGYVPDPPQR